MTLAELRAAIAKTTLRPDVPLVVPDDVGGWSEVQSVALVRLRFWDGKDYRNELALELRSV